MQFKRFLNVDLMHVLRSSCAMLTNSSLFELESPTHNRNRFIYCVTFYLYFDSLDTTHLTPKLPLLIEFIVRIVTLFRQFPSKRRTKLKRNLDRKSWSCSFFINTLESCIWCNVFLFWWNLSAKNYCQSDGTMHALHQINQSNNNEVNTSPFFSHFHILCSAPFVN